MQGSDNVLFADIVAKQLARKGTQSVPSTSSTQQTTTRGRSTQTQAHSRTHLVVRLLVWVVQQ